ncbi:hypothetical protein M434DRAFT_72750, partial [Hypoxylon sp. CO27-5]
SIDVMNPNLKAHLSRIFEGYSEVHKDAPKMEFKPPFIPFVHNWDRLRGAEIAGNDKTGKKLLALLIESVEKEVKDSLHALRDLQKTGYVKFHDILVAFRPGEIIIRSEDGVISAGILKRASIIKTRFAKWCDIEVDVVDWDGKNTGYREANWRIEPFDGFQKLSDLVCSPLMSHDDPERVRLQLVKRGKIFEDLRGQHIKHYTGFARSASDQLSDGTKENISMNVLSKISYDCPNREELPQLTDEQRIITVPTVRGFALERKMWCKFKIANTSPITWNDQIFKNLVLDNREKELLLALVARKSASGDVVFDDFTKGKGKGLLLLLCGAPGIGKTLTAEAVAEKLRRPLYRVRAGDLGVTADKVEASLKKALDRCAHWNAVLLIDEADIFLEKRSTNDIVRSELVSIFLVLLEYYEGIMILTTNRIECIDPAFESRVDIILAYKDLTQDTRRHIWYNFIQRLPAETVSISAEALDDLSRYNLNGRQIKSSVKTGWTLSASRGELLRKEHLDLVLGIREKGSKLLGIEDYGIRDNQEGLRAPELSSIGLLVYPDIDSDIYYGPGWVFPMVAVLLYTVLLYHILPALDYLI